MAERKIKIIFNEAILDGMLTRLGISDDIVDFDIIKSL